jgi:hypothetical protein
MTSCVDINPSHRLNGYLDSFEQSLVTFNSRFAFICDMLDGKNDKYVKNHIDRDVEKLKETGKEISRVFTLVDSYRQKSCCLFTNFTQTTIKIIEVVLVFLGFSMMIYSVHGTVENDELINVTDEIHLFTALLCKYGTITALVGWFVGQFGHYSLLRMLCLQKSQRVFSKVLNNRSFVDLSANICRMTERGVSQYKTQSKSSAARTTLVVALRKLKNGFSVQLEKEFDLQGMRDCGESIESEPSPKGGDIV